MSAGAPIAGQWVRPGSEGPPYPATWSVNFSLRFAVSELSRRASSIFGASTSGFANASSSLRFSRSADAARSPARGASTGAAGAMRAGAAAEVGGGVSNGGGDGATRFSSLDSLDGTVASGRVPGRDYCDIERRGGRGRGRGNQPSHRQARGPPGSGSNRRRSSRHGRQNRLAARASGRMALGGSQDMRGQGAVHPRGDGLGIETVRAVRAASSRSALFQRRCSDRSGISRSPSSSSYRTIRFHILADDIAEVHRTRSSSAYSKHRAIWSASSPALISEVPLDLPDGSPVASARAGATPSPRARRARGPSAQASAAGCSSTRAAVGRAPRAPHRHSAPGKIARYRVRSGSAGGGDEPATACGSSSSGNGSRRRRARMASTCRCARTARSHVARLLRP